MYIILRNFRALEERQDSIAELYILIGPLGEKKKSATGMNAIGKYIYIYIGEPRGIVSPSSFCLAERGRLTGIIKLRARAAAVVVCIVGRGSRRASSGLGGEKPEVGVVLYYGEEEAFAICIYICCGGGGGLLVYALDSTA